MGFDIFVSTNTGYGYSKPGCEDGSTFEVINIITILQGLEFNSAGRFAISAAGAVKEKVAKGIPDLMFKLAEMEMCQNISNAVCMLAMNPNASSGWISVNATQKNLLFPNVSKQARYNFMPGNSPGAEFLKTIGKCLEETDLNNFGVLQYLAFVLTKYEQKLPSTKAPMISISLTK